MSQENVEIVKRGFEYYFATGEVLWELLDENVEVHDYDRPDPRRLSRTCGLRPMA